MKKEKIKLGMAHQENNWMQSQVKAARADEMHFFKEFQVYVKVPESECWEKTGKGPIGTRWIDINKGDEVNPDYRSRLLAQGIKTDKIRSCLLEHIRLSARRS